MASYPEFHRRSIQDPEGFWREQARRIDWHTPFTQVLDYSRPPFARWFVGGTTNLCHNAVDRHLAARAEQNALIYVSTETDTRKIYTFKQLHREVNRMAGMLRGLGVGRGDRVLIYMPMVPEAVFAMLACARIGAIHSVVFGGFASVSLATRIDDARPKVIVTADAGSRAGKVVPYKPLLDEAIALAQVPPPNVMMVTAAWRRSRRCAGRDHDYARLRAAHMNDEVAVRVARVDRSLVHPLHLGHDRKAEGCAARHRRLCGRARGVDEAHLLRFVRGRRDVLLDQRHRLGRRSQLHRLRPVDRRHGDDPLRRHADASRRRHLVATSSRSTR